MAGRKKKFGENELITYVCEMVIKDPCTHISPTTLEKTTGVPKHIWKSASYKKLQRTLKLLKYSNLQIINGGIEITNPAEIIERNINDKKKLIHECELLNIVLNNLYKSLETLRESYAALQIENNNLRCQLDATTSPEDEDEQLIMMLNEYNDM